MGKTCFVSLGWQMIYPKSKGVSKLLPFFLLLILFCFLSSLESWRKLLLRLAQFYMETLTLPKCTIVEALLCYIHV